MSIKNKKTINTVHHPRKRPPPPHSQLEATLLANANGLSKISPPPPEKRKKEADRDMNRQTDR